MPMNSHLPPEDEPRFPSTGPKREAPAVCYVCGREIDEPRFGDVTCGRSECREAMVRR